MRTHNRFNRTAFALLIWTAMTASLLFLGIGCGSEETVTHAEVEDIVRSATRRQLSRADVREIVDESVAEQLAAQPRLTRAEVEAIVGAATAEQLTAADVQEIVDESVAAQISRKAGADTCGGRSHCRCSNSRSTYGGRRATGRRRFAGRPVGCKAGADTC